jgi:hypothetical protein
MTTMTSTAVRLARRLSAKRAALALLAAGAVTAGAFQLAPVRNADGGQAPRIIRIESTQVADFSDDRRLAGFAEDVFLGQVAGAGSTIDKPPLVETDFPVRVLETIKGSARGTVTVTQQGGYLPGNNELQLIDGDPPLQPGRTYLFATRSDPAGRHYLVPRFGDVPVQDAAHRTELRERFTEAGRSPIPVSPQG